MTRSDEQESAGGSRILRHSQTDRERTPPAHGSPIIEEVTGHFEARGIPAENVLHEVASDLVHVDVNISVP